MPLLGKVWQIGLLLFDTLAPMRDIKRQRMLYFAQVILDMHRYMYVREMLQPDLPKSCSILHVAQITYFFHLPSNSITLATSAILHIVNMIQTWFHRKCSFFFIVSLRYMTEFPVIAFLVIFKDFVYDIYHFGMSSSPALQAAELMGNPTWKIFLGQSEAGEWLVVLKKKHAPYLS